ncbi:MAG: pentapeptide repeat-containing protein [Leucobacter sp.]
MTPPGEPATGPGSPHLSGADLNGADLNGADLSGS